MSADALPSAPLAASPPGPPPSPDACLALLLDGPMQSWGHASRFERRTTALHPTRSAVFGLLAAALGIDKHGANEAGELVRFGSLRFTVVILPRRLRQKHELMMQRLEDYHTVTGIRRASGKVDKDATVQTYRHYLLDARFGVLLEGPAVLLEEIATALRNPKWGVWLGRKCCVPASPVLVALKPDQAQAWSELVRRIGYAGTETIDQFDRVIEVAAGEAGADVLEDAPVGFGNPIGERHAPRWIRRHPKSPPQPPKP
jgi:CRISPR system Cascade subunit CasD